MRSGLRSSRIAALTMVLTAAMALTGCTADGNSILAGKPQVNLLEKNYGAADYLIQNASGFVKKSDLIELQPLVNAQDAVFTGKISTIIPEQIGTRFTQLGYRVDFDKIQNASPGASGLTTSSAPYALSGTYVRHLRTVDVDLKIADTKTGRSVSSLRYTLPVSKELDGLSAQKPLIYRTSSGE
jgi:hypothetical protein